MLSHLTLLSCLNGTPNLRCHSWLARSEPDVFCSLKDTNKCLEVSVPYDCLSTLGGGDNMTLRALFRKLSLDSKIPLSLILRDLNI